MKTWPVILIMDGGYIIVGRQKCTSVITSKYTRQLAIIAAGIFIGSMLTITVIALIMPMFIQSEMKAARGPATELAISVMNDPQTRKTFIQMLCDAIFHITKIRPTGCS